MTERELHIVASTLWGEARGEGVDGMVAVAWVIRNRVNRDSWPDTYARVCLQERQFSLWNPNDTNRVMAHLITYDSRHFRDAMFAALGVLQGHLPDPTNGSDHYHTDAVAPAWATRMTRTVKIGHHVFYNSRLPVPA